LYRLPGLTELTGVVKGKLPAIEGIEGLDPEAAQVFVRTPKRELLGLDLESGRVDTIATDLRRAALGPDGTLYAVDGKRRVTTLARRVRLVWPQPLASEPRDMFGATDQRLVAVTGGHEPKILTASADQPPASRPVPSEGDMVATEWGDLVAVASDSGVTFLDPLGRRDMAFVPIEDHPRVLLFSPSGHRVYVGKRGALGLAVIDRYAHRELDGIALPAPIAAMRLDPYGEWLLAAPGAGDTAWVVDLPVKHLVGALPTSWRADLPTVTPDGTLLARSGNDIVAWSPDSLGERGRVKDGAADLWIATDWQPRGVRVAPAPGAAVATDSAAAEGPLYVQVSVSQNPAWSSEMAQQLNRAGLPAKVLSPSSADEGYRVVLGPYPTREQAEAIGKKLGRPYWIFAANQ
jgi:DNA-binding beta-propeller fold protein YncE